MKVGNKRLPLKRRTLSGKASDRPAIPARYQHVDLGVGESTAPFLQSARKALDAGPLVLSVVSYWEVVIKCQKGMLKIADPVNWWSRATNMLGGDVLSIRTSHISLLADLPDIHKDPFDRMLIAQAAAEGLALIASDRIFGRYPVKVLW